MTSSLTILQLLPSLETGGAERTAIDISRALCDAGHRSIVASGGGFVLKVCAWVDGESWYFPGMPMA